MIAARQVMLASRYASLIKYLESIELGENEIKKVIAHLRENGGSRTVIVLKFKDVDNYIRLIRTGAYRYKQTDIINLRSDSLYSRNPSPYRMAILGCENSMPTDKTTWQLCLWVAD